MEKSSNTLSWALNFSSSAGSESTVYNYLVYDSTDTGNLVQLTTVRQGTHSLNLASFGLAAGTHVLYVKAVGQPLILNQMSNGVSYYVP